MNPLTRLSSLAAALVVCSALSAGPLFRDPLPIALGTGHNGEVVMADFTGDSRPDLSVGNLAVVPGKAGGPFGTPIVSPLEHYARASAAGDVNGDGKQDLVRVRAGALSIFLGNGNGTFTAGATISTLLNAGPSAVADFTGDGKLDVFVAPGDYNTFGDPMRFALHAGDGAGGFAAAVTTDLGNPAVMSQVEAADVNGDGRADAILGNGSVAHVHLSLSGGTFSRYSSWSTTARWFALGHVNGDSAIDLVASHGDGLEILAGNGNGTFTSLASYAVPPGRVALADMNNDGIRDVVALGRTTSVLLGNGAGTFAEPLHFRAAGGVSLAVADFDGDGKRDVVSLPPHGFYGYFARGNGDGTLALDRTYLARAPAALATDTTHEPVIADVDGDTKPDVVTVVWASSTADQISILRNDGAGGLRPAVRTGAGARAASFTAGRVNDDVYADVVVLRSDTPSVTTFLGSAAGTLTAGATSSVNAGDAAVPLRLADVNGDGKTDLVTYARYYPGNGAGGFGAAVTPGTTFERLADLDGNGSIDTVWTDDNRNFVGLNDGTGTFTVTSFSSTDYVVAVGDFTGDGKPDLAGVTVDYSYHDAYGVRAGNGDGTFGGHVKTVVDTSLGFVDRPVTADFNGDGHLDLLAEADVLFGDGAAAFRDLTYVGGYRRTAADMDGNGRADVVSVYGDTVTLLRSGLAAGPFATPAVAVLDVPSGSSYTEEVAFEMSIANTTPRPVTGTVTIRVDGKPLAVVGVLTWFDANPASAIGSLLRALPVGAHTVTMTYNGDHAYRSAGVSLSHTVSRAATSIAGPAVIAATYGAWPYADPVLNFPRVSYLPGPADPAFTFFFEGEEVPRSGNALLLELDTGTWPLTVSYAGDANYEPSTAPVTIQVNKGHPSAFINVSPAPAARMAGPVTFVVSLPATGAAYGELTGTVTLFINGQPLETRTVANREASFTTTLAAGTYYVRAEYNGDPNHLATVAEQSVEVYVPWETPLVVQAAVDGTTVHLSWLPYREATHYVVYLKGKWAHRWQTIHVYEAQYVRNIMPLDATWMYKVEARRPTGTRPSAPFLVTTVAFTDPNGLRGVKVKRSHVTELRTAVNAVRAFAGLTPAAFTDTTPAIAKAVHVEELRTALSQARSAIGMPVTFTDPALTARTSVIRAVHIEELRNGTR
ncbi:MAG TPA: FG-GAP-like repeat-containing protein [Thermoanaerobaculia bacterium]|jgi:hypothetical protein